MTALGFSFGPALRKQIAHALEVAQFVRRPHEVVLTVRPDDARLALRENVYEELRAAGRRSEADRVANILQRHRVVVAIVLREREPAKVLGLVELQVALAEQVPKPTAPKPPAPRPKPPAVPAAPKKPKPPPAPPARELSAGERVACAVLARRPLEPPWGKRGAS